MMLHNVTGGINIDIYESWDATLEKSVFPGGEERERNETFDRTTRQKVKCPFSSDILILIGFSLFGGMAENSMNRKSNSGAVNGAKETFLE